MKSLIIKTVILATVVSAIAKDKIVGYEYNDTILEIYQRIEPNLFTANGSIDTPIVYKIQFEIKNGKIKKKTDTVYATVNKETYVPEKIIWPTFIHNKK
ncbi:MAG: hypothetical protein KJN62_03835 [Deltaproteobacteria bacterium]|nr:hypothetical protein [Deltaproteobacteria bacterium]